MNVLTDTLTPDAGSVWLASGTTKSKPGALHRVTFGVDHRIAADLQAALYDEGSILCHVEGWQVLSSLQETCSDCSGTGSVPAGGWEPAEVVSNGQVPCTTCTHTDEEI